MFKLQYQNLKIKLKLLAIKMYLKLDKFSHIFNLSIDPKIKSKQYKFTNKIDEKICRKIKIKILFIFFHQQDLYEKKKK